MEFRIRPYEERDLAGINAIKRMRGVAETTLSLYSENIAFTAQLMRGVSPASPNLCAVIDTPEGETVIGNGLLRLTEKARVRHTASVALIVHAGYQDKGVGRALLSQLLEIADDQLMLVRVSLEVTADNARAIHLYESLGFQTEGRLKYAIMSAGEYKDLIIMGRYRLP